MKNFYDRLWQQSRPFGSWLNDNFQYHYTFFKPYIGEKILDYGCGDGDFLNRFYTAGVNVYGFDISQNAIDRVKARAKLYCPQDNFTCNILDFPDDYFDTIFLLDVLEHIPDLTEALEEIKRVIRLRGHLLIATNELNPIKAALISLFFFERYFSPLSPHLRYFTKRTLARILEDNDFEVIKYKWNRSYLGLLPKGQLVVAKSK